MSQMARGELHYPSGQEPNYWLPDPASARYRFVLGSLASPAASNPLVVIGMNPSHASDAVSDRTVNKVIAASLDLGYSGWTILNLYPERAASPKRLSPFDQSLSDRNCEAIAKFVTAHSIGEVFGGWGNPPHPTIRQARDAVLAELRRLGTRVFYLGGLTKRGQPRHPNPRRGAWDLTGPKNYLT